MITFSAGAGVLLALVSYFFSNSLEYRIKRVSAKWLAEAGIQYGINRIQASPWLADIYDGALDRTYHRVSTANNKGSNATQPGHYIHYKGQNFMDIADRISHALQEAGENKNFLPENSDIYIWAAPRHYRDSGYPVWDGRWHLHSIGIHENVSVHRAVEIQTPSFIARYIISGRRSVKLLNESGARWTLQGSLSSQGAMTIDTGISIQAAIPVQSMGNLTLLGDIQGDIVTTSITAAPPFSRADGGDLSHRAVGTVTLKPAFEKRWKPVKIKGYFPYYYRRLKVWGGRKQRDSDISAFPYCADSTGKFSADFIDAADRIQCEYGFSGLWIDTVEFPDYPAYKASRPGEFPERSRKTALEMLAAEKGTATLPESFSSEYGDFKAFLPQTLPPGDSMVSNATPMLDWEQLRAKASSSPEHHRKDGKGTLFGSWELFTDYINDASHDLVHHIFQEKGCIIRVGNYDAAGQPLEPIVIYIEKAPWDEGTPDLGCFGVLKADTAIQINGSIVCETGFDLREMNFHAEPPGRWRDFTTGRDGRVIAYCGGIKLTRADSPEACRDYGVYRWCRDGAAGVEILGAPDIPAIAAGGDIWIVNRRSRTEIHGGLFAPEGRIFLVSREENPIIIHGYIYGKDVEIHNRIQIDESERNNSSTYIKILDSPVVRISGEANVL